LAGLSTFQQSVAMDRLRRIVGVLQKPDLGYFILFYSTIHFSASY